MFARVSDITDSIEAGRIRTCSFRKVPSQPTTLSGWADFSMAGGNPPPNYYASSPLVAARLDGMRGIFHGDDVSPSGKFLTRLGIACVSANQVPLWFNLCDYLLYYPFVDLDDPSEQPCDNTITLPRYTTGEGVMAMAVALTPQSAGNGTFTFTYTDPEGVDRTSPVNYCTTAGVSISNLVTGSPTGVAGPSTPFLLTAPEQVVPGIRKIIAVTPIIPNGGLVAIVLVKPLLNTGFRELNGVRELCLPQMGMAMPRIYDGAYLNLLSMAAASQSGLSFFGYADFVWR